MRESIPQPKNDTLPAAPEKQTEPASLKQAPEGVARRPNYNFSQVTSGQVQRKDKGKKKEEEKEPDDEIIQAKPLLQRQEDEGDDSGSGEETLQSKHINQQIQHKIKVGPSNDKYEMEADRMADRVMAPQPTPPTPAADAKSGGPAPLRRKEDEPQEKDADDEKIQSKGSSLKNGGQVSGKTAGDIETMRRSGGKPLPESEKQFFEPRMGYDLSNVRVHEGGPAEKSAKSVQSRAFTLGKDVVFGQGEYRPGTQEGRHLMAHELTHTIQQGATVKRKESPETKNEQISRMPEADVQRKAEVVGPTPTAESVPTPFPNIGKSTDADSESTKTDDTTEKKETDVKEEEEVKETDATAGTDSGGDSAPSGLAPGANKEAPKKEAKEEEIAPAKESEDQLKPAAKETPAAADAPIVTAPMKPGDDPAYQALKGDVEKTATGQSAHSSAKSKAAHAGAAARGPANEVASKAQGRQVGRMAGAPPGEFDEKTIKAAILAQIKKIAPKTLKEADKFKEENKIDQVKSNIQQNVGAKRENAEKNIEQKTKEAPSPAGIKSKSVVKLPPTPPGTAPNVALTGRAAVKKRTDQEVSLDKGSKQLDKQMTDADVTKTQLDKSNEPSFKQAGSAKDKAQADAKKAPKDFRKSEKGVLKQSQSQASSGTKKGVAGMYNLRKLLLKKVTGSQQKGKGQDEKKRAKVAGDIQAIYESTKTGVETHLKNLGKDVNSAFDSGAKAAQIVFENYVSRKMTAYKKKRYGSKWSLLTRAKDFLLGLPEEVNRFYEEGQKLYLKIMERVVDQVVRLVSQGLKRAKKLIKTGKKKIHSYVRALPRSLRGYGLQAEKEINKKFGELETKVSEKKGQLIKSLAKKYSDNMKQVKSKIELMKTINGGLVGLAGKLMDAVIGKILALKKQLEKLFAKAKSVIGKIIADPIGFLKNLITAVKTGVMNFVKNIGSHLKKGFMAWLFGTMASGGIQMPKTFDFKGIMTLLVQVAGLTYTNFRARAVKILGEKVVGALETTAKIFKILITKGPMGLWEYIKDKLKSSIDKVIDGIKNMLIVEVIKAGVMWIISLLNPASAFVKAVKAIVDIVMFFVERGQQIIALVNAVLDSISAIANGNLGAAAKKVEQSLARAIPVAIGFLASLLGLGGLSSKVQKIVATIQKPVNRIMDWLIRKAAKIIRKLVRKGKLKAKQLKKKIVSWWLMRKKFKMKSGKAHTLKFKGRGKKAKLMRHSTPEVLDDYLKDFMAKATPEQKTNAGPIISQINTHIAAIEKIKADSGGGWGKADGETIRKKLNSIADELKKLTDGSDIPETIVKFTTHSIGGTKFGKTMIANPLSLRTGPTAKGGSADGDEYVLAGSGPSDKSAAFTDVSRNKHPETEKGKSKSRYVRGHLLNHHVHGPGINQNMTPISDAYNTQMETEFEDKVKTAVLSQNKVVSYSVHVIYSESHHRKNEHKDRLPLEYKLASSFLFQAHELGQDKDNKWTVRKGNLFSPKIKIHNLPLPSGEVAPNPTIDLSKATKESLEKEFTGLGSGKAEKIINALDSNGHITLLNLEEVGRVGSPLAKTISDKYGIK